MFAVLRRRNFALLWFGQLVSLTGDYVLLVALPFYTYQLTGSVLDTGLMFLVQGLPSLLLGSLAGVFVDRWDRRYTMIASDFLRMGILLFLLFVHTRDLVWIIYVVAFSEQVVSQFFLPAKGAIIPHLVDEPQLMAANSLNSTSDALTRLVGPPLGGALLAFFGLTSVVLIDSASYLISGIMILLIILPRATQAMTSTAAQPSSFAAALANVWREWLEGLRLVQRSRLLLTLFVAACLIMLSQGIINVLIVVFVKAILHGSATTFGLLITFQGIGMLAGSVLVGQVGKRIKPVYLLAIGTTPSGLLLLIIVTFPNVLLTFALLTVLGVLIVGFFVTEQTLFQTQVEDAYRGRVLGAYNTTYSLFYIIGLSCGSFLGTLLGITGALGVAGGLFALVGIVTLIMLRGVQIDLSGKAEEAKQGAVGQEVVAEGK